MALEQEVPLVHQVRQEQQALRDPQEVLVQLVQVDEQEELVRLGSQVHKVLLETLVQLVVQEPLDQQVK